MAGTIDVYLLLHSDTQEIGFINSRGQQSNLLNSQLLLHSELKGVMVQQGASWSPGSLV